jgi:hypothetical protein
MPVLRPNIVHRRSRRRLTRGAVAGADIVTVAVTSTGTTNATLTYSRPVVLRGLPALSVATRTLVSAALTAPNVVSVVLSGNATGLAYTVAGGDPNVTPSQGGAVSGTAGTFS